MEKLKGKDLINVGIYSAIYFVIMMIVAMVGDVFVWRAEAAGDHSLRYFG